MKRVAFGLILAISFVLTGCGSGGGGSSDDSTSASSNSTIVEGKTIVDYGEITKMSTLGMYLSDRTGKFYRVYTNKSCLGAGAGLYTYEHYDVYFEVYADNTMATLWTNTRAGETGVCDIREVYEAINTFEGTSLTIKRLDYVKTFIEPATGNIYYINPRIETKLFDYNTLDIPDYFTEKTVEVVNGEMIVYEDTRSDKTPDYAYIEKMYRLIEKF